MRPVTLFTGQWADLPIETLCQQAVEFGYDGLELACWGDHFEVDQATDAYCQAKRELLAKYDLALFSISNHLVGQAVCDAIDSRHQAILPPRIFGDGSPEGVRQRAAEEMIATGQAAARLGVDVVNGFTGSSIWHLLYSFPPVSPDMIEAGFADFAARWKPILDQYQALGVKFALEVHPTEIAFDIASAERAIQALDGHPAFGFNYDPSHLGYQGVDYVEFIYRFSDRIFHVHMKDVGWSATPTDGRGLRRAHRVRRPPALLGLPLVGPWQYRLSRKSSAPSTASTTKGRCRSNGKTAAWTASTARQKRPPSSSRSISPPSDISFDAAFED